MPILVTIGFAGLCLILAIAHHGLAALVVGGVLLALMIVVPSIENAISADSIAPRRRPPQRRQRRR